MKKVLLGTSALVAASLIAGEASAQNLQAGLAGFIRNWWSAFDLPSGSTGRDLAFTSNNEVFFVGSAKLNNGMTYGFRIELEAWSQTAAANTNAHDQIDEVWAYIRGSFGEIRFGEEDDVRKLKAWSPYIGGLLGADSPDAVYALRTSTTYLNTENDAPKIIYFSPSFSGFSFGVSYAPDATHGTRSFAVQGKNDCDGTQSRGCNGNNFSIAADYRGKFGDANVGFDIGYTTSNNEVAANKDVNIFRADLFFGFDGWEIGGQYQKGSHANGNNLDITTYGGGILYTTGNWQFGLIGQRDKREVTGGSSNKQGHYLIGAAYRLGAGVQVLGSLNYQRLDNAATADQTATTLVLGIAASF
jgi:outer membrane protein OmpU